MGVTSSPVIGPLTTFFTPPTSCLSTITSGGVDTDSKGSTYCLGMSYNTVDPSCYPESFTVDHVYSPGVCPMGWTSACSPQAAGDPSYFASTVTAMQCCPMGMVCKTISSTDNFAWCSSVAVTSDATLLEYSNTTSSTLETTSLFSIEVFAKPIFAAYESTDTEVIALLTATSSSATSTASPGSTAVQSLPTTTTSSASTSTAASTSSGLSEGAKIGLGVGITFGVLILALLGYMAYIHKKSKVAILKAVSSPESGHQHASMAPVNYGQQSQPYPGSMAHEVSGEQKPQYMELDGTPRYELQ